MAKPKHDARAETSALATASAAPTGGDPVAPAPSITAGEKAGEGNEAAAAPTSPSPAAPVAPSPVAGKAIVDTQRVADTIALAATPVVKVTASRDRWRAKRFWPKGETALTETECDQLGHAGFEQLRTDPVFTIVLLDRAD